ncbi:MAG: hypothetical protein ACTS22_09920 [Phycisphaerales bacterium]
MSVLPETNSARISFFENHLPVWAPIAADIGLTPAQIATLTTLTADARNAYNAALAARDAAKAATQTQNDAIAAMTGLGADLVKTIRAYAQTTDDPGVYAAAQIPAPRTPAPLGPAPTPTDLTAAITNTGAVQLTWNAETRGRVGFVIERRTTLPGQPAGGWTLIGTATNKSFLDELVPTGLENAQYRVTAERPGGRSQPTEPIVVLFGTGAPAQHPGDLRLAA